MDAEARKRRDRHRPCWIHVQVTKDERALFDRVCQLFKGNQRETVYAALAQLEAELTNVVHLFECVKCKRQLGLSQAERDALEGICPMCWGCDRSLMVPVP